ncbi:MAG: DUF998 domain-containing protein [Ignisphaera sp.]|nr:DUF998 domain-containing protein [Ignisphaera sp.]MCX8167747.1 DUF998 domain-containing protein [Ignisphaera sp.]MDW8086219.1 DUF998 domain-containing protein [Ignisphaera sp.]
MERKKINQILRCVWRFLGIAAAISAWLTILLSILQNQWFDLYKHALSDLGDPKANKPWIYNGGLIIVGAMTCVYSFYIVYRSSNKGHAFASALIFTAGVFLALIGIYPSGTRPHTFVSTWFFVQMWLATIATMIAMIMDRNTIYAIIPGIVAVAGPLGAVFIRWPSIALLEIFGILLIDVYIIVLTLYF